MITAAIHGMTVAPRERINTGGDTLGALSSEIAARIAEMDEIRDRAGTDLVLRLASIARLDQGAFRTVVAVMHGDTSVLTDSYSERAQSVGRKKQTVHYRTTTEIESIRAVFPAVADILSEIRLSVKHHEDPVSKGQVIREAME
jgi:hypothetical protein